MVPQVLFSLSILVIIALINIGSTAALNSIFSLLTGATAFSYAVSISCLLIRRLRRDPLPPPRCSMGRFSIPVNAFAVLYIVIAAIASFFPVEAVVTPASMNWSCIMFGGVFIIAVVYYLVHGLRHYVTTWSHVNQSLAQRSAKTLQGQWHAFAEELVSGVSDWEMLSPSARDPHKARNHSSASDIASPFTPIFNVAAAASEQLVAIKVEPGVALLSSQTPVQHIPSTSEDDEVATRPAKRQCTLELSTIEELLALEEAAGSIDCEEEDERIFRMFVAWLYSQKLAPPSKPRVVGDQELLSHEPVSTSAYVEAEEQGLLRLVNIGTRPALEELRFRQSPQPGVETAETESNFTIDSEEGGYEVDYSSTVSDDGEEEQQKETSEDGQDKEDVDDADPTLLDHGSMSAEEQKAAERRLSWKKLGSTRRIL
ncbi:hypothetical protein LTR49_024571 [Elasticomyces elasticus]|nr:hypothetical protein LTR49_024571 [Elasticomyces elasticus]KAK5739723.1 hypothetical protein LTS12_025174 [Elasticomyces elasticus]